MIILLFHIVGGGKIPRKIEGRKISKRCFCEGRVRILPTRLSRIHFGTSLGRTKPNLSANISG